MKTAMQQLLEVLQRNAKNIQPMDIDNIISLIELDYIQIEKQLIIETFKNAQLLHVMGDETRGEQFYYNLTNKIK